MSAASVAPFKDRSRMFGAFGPVKDREVMVGVDLYVVREMNVPGKQPDPMQPPMTRTHCAAFSPLGLWRALEQLGVDPTQIVWHRWTASGWRAIPTPSVKPWCEEMAAKVRG